MFGRTRSRTVIFNWKRKEKIYDAILCQTPLKDWHSIVINTLQNIDFTIISDRCLFVKHIPDIYPTELQLNKANTSDKESSLLDLNRKLLALMFALSITKNAMTSDFLSSISPGWVLMFLDSHRKLFTFLSWIDLLGVALEFRIFSLKICK